MGGVPGDQYAVRGGDARGDRVVRGSGVHPGLPSRARRTRAAGLTPQARTALFWHIPWPHPDRLRICPWRRELVAGLLANDLIAFQLERDRRNFLMAAEEELNAELEIESSRFVSAGAPRPWCRCRSAWTTTAFRRLPLNRRSPRNSGAFVRCSASERRSSGSASIGSTIRKGSRNVSKRSTCSSLGGPICAAG